jgi:hypothetical protein
MKPELIKCRGGFGAAPTPAPVGHDENRSAGGHTGTLGAFDRWCVRLWLDQAGDQQAEKQWIHSSRSCLVAERTQKPFT